MNLLFDQLIVELEKVSYDKIKFSFWDYEEPEINSWEREERDAGKVPNAEEQIDEPSKEELHKTIFEKFNERQYFTTIANLLKRYF